MDLLESHFANIKDGNLWYDDATGTGTGTYTMFGGTGASRHHVCYQTFKEFFRLLLESPRKCPNILETGTASWGTSSTFLLDAYVRKYGGRLWTCDINPEVSRRAGMLTCPGTTLVTKDSVQFLQEWCRACPGAAAHVYLDSYDLDWYDPNPSGLHGLKEYLAVRPALQENSLLLIDDTPASPYWMDCRDGTYSDMVRRSQDPAFIMPGKGMFIRKVIGETEAECVLHQYQLLYKFR